MDETDIATHDFRTEANATQTSLDDFANERSTIYSSYGEEGNGLDNLKLKVKADLEKEQQM